MVENIVLPFKSGDRVECINDDFCTRIQKGKIYIVDTIIANKFVTLHSVFAKGNYPRPRFKLNKFVLVNESKLIEFL